MTRYRIKVVLLTLGVVLGFGSAIARHHYGHHGGHWLHGHDNCWDGVESKKPNDAARPTDR